MYSCGLVTIYCQAGSISSDCGLVTIYCQVGSISSDCIVVDWLLSTVRLGALVQIV